MVSIISRLRQLYGVRSLPHSLACVVGLAIVLCLPLIVSGQCVGGQCNARMRLRPRAQVVIPSMAIIEQAQPTVTKTKTVARRGRLFSWFGR